MSRVQCVPLVLVLMIIGSVFAAGCSGEALGNQFPLEIIERFADARIVVYTQQSAIDRAPAWNPVEGGPPLTIEALLKTLRK